MYSKVIQLHTHTHMHTTFFYRFSSLMLLLLLSHFSRVRLCATPWTAAYQASPSMGSQRVGHAAAAAKSLQSCPTLCDPIDGSPPGSPVPGIFQARVLEWGAIAFSEESGLIFTKGPWQSWSRNLEWYSTNRLVHVCWIYKVYLGTPCH